MTEQIIDIIRMHLGLIPLNIEKIQEKILNCKMFDELLLLTFVPDFSNNEQLYLKNNYIEVVLTELPTKYCITFRCNLTFLDDSVKITSKTIFLEK